MQFAPAASTPQRPPSRVRMPDSFRCLAIDLTPIALKSRCPRAPSARLAARFRPGWNRSPATSWCGGRVARRLQRRGKPIGGNAPFQKACRAFSSGIPGFSDGTGRLGGRVRTSRIANQIRGFYRGPARERRVCGLLAGVRVFDLARSEQGQCPVLRLPSCLKPEMSLRAILAHSGPASFALRSEGFGLAARLVEPAYFHVGDAPFPLNWAG